jgi:Tol biopolymer transport system component
MAEAPDPVTKHRDTVPAALESIVMRCLEKKPADRWRYAEDLLPQLEALATPSGGMTPTGTAPMRASRGSALTPVRIAAIAVVVAAVIGGVLWVNRGNTRLPLQPGRQTQLTFAPGLELDPAISPDGRWIAYAAGPAGQMHIFVQPVAGGRAVDVSDGLAGSHAWPKWSPDGTKVLFQAQGELYLVPPTGGAVRRVLERPATGDASGACWNPDGRNIAFTASLSDLMMVAVEGGEPHVIAEDYEPHSCSWSPDGSRLVYVSGNQDYLFRTILANRASSVIRVLSLPDGTTTTLTEEEGMFQSPLWMPSGDRVLFVSNVGGSRDIYELSVDASGEGVGPATRLTTGSNVFTMSLSAEGRTLAYSVFRHDANIWSIGIPSAGTISASEATPITEGGQAIEGIGVSPDGRWLVFDSDRRGNADIYRMMFPDGEPEQLTDDPADDMIPSWSPDGQEIVFYSFRHGTRDVFVMNADGGNEQRVTDDPAQDRYPDWSPDGNSIVFQSDRTGRSELWVVSREDRSSEWGTPRQLTVDGGALPRWSPDGRWVAYRRRGTWIIPPEGGEPRLIADLSDYGTSPQFPEWSSDGRTVYIKAWGSEGRASFWSARVDGGTPRLLVRFDDPAVASHRAEFTTDGERFYFTIGRQESDIWMMELLNVQH